MYGIYARQSVEKRDSVSIEMQIELCRKLVPEGTETRVYEDKGYTGTNVKRPAFQQMLAHIRSGEIEGILVYKLDRISRSLSDFARLSEELETHHVKLISYGENFDTGSPMGMMLVHMLIMFAEMEQKTISTRIRDNYYARAAMKKELGGIPPYGFQKDWTVERTESQVVFSIYQQALCGKSLDCTAQMLNQQQIPSPKEKTWTGMQIGRILRNPAYVESNAAVYAYFQKHGARMLHPAEEYCTGCGCHAIQNEDTLCIAAGTHKGFVPPALWLAVQEKLRQKKPSCNGGSGESSWLQGLVLCGYCGASCYVRSNGKGKPYVYFACRGKRMGTCRGLKAVRTQPIEDAIAQVLSAEIERLLSEAVTVPEDTLLACSQLDAEIAQTVQFMGAHPSAAEDMACQLEQLYEKRNQLSQQVQRTFHKINGSGESLWKALSFAQKKAAAHLLLQNVIVTEKNCTVILR
ncbi:MAG: recombinase family protein [Ruminococcus sp.]